MHCHPVRYCNKNFAVIHPSALLLQSHMIQANMLASRTKAAHDQHLQP
jgi:hypothetical protein